MQFLQRLGQQLAQLWLGMSRARRVALVAVAVVSAAAILGVGYWAAQPEYRLLYSNLSPEDAGAITAKLRDQNVPFHLTSSGTTVLVPAERVAQLRLDLAREGIGGGYGVEADDKSALFQTPGAEQDARNRRVQAELARTIMQMEPVAAARSGITRPDVSPFVRDQKPPTASVLLKLKPGAVFSRGMATGVLALVAHSVPGLTTDNVTLADTAGRVYSENPNAVPASQLEYKRAVESYLATKAEEMLAQVLGPGRGIVRVTADINYKSLTETKESYDLEQKAVKKESINTHKSTTSVSASRGTAGATSNSSKSGAGQSPTGTNDNEETSDTDYYPPPKTIQQRVEGAGNVERLTVAAMIDLTKGEDASAAPTLTLAEAQDIIKQAVGFKTSRDEIKVTSTKLLGTPSNLEGEAAPGVVPEGYAQFVRYGGYGIAALVVLGVGWAVLRRGKTAVKPETVTTQPTVDREALIQNISTLGQKDPEQLVQMLTLWLDEEEVETVPMSRERPVAPARARAA